MPDPTHIDRSRGDWDRMLPHAPPDPQELLEDARWSARRQVERSLAERRRVNPNVPPEFRGRHHEADADEFGDYH